MLQRSGQSPYPPPHHWRRSKTEAEAFQADGITLSDLCMLKCYQSVSVEPFSLAFVRDMGWRPRTGTGWSSKGLNEAHLRSSRTALLGFGAKPRETVDIGRNGRFPWYVPIVAKEKEWSERRAESDRDLYRESRGRDRAGGDRTCPPSQRHSHKRWGEHKGTGRKCESDRRRGQESPRKRRLASRTTAAVTVTTMTENERTKKIVKSTGK